MLLAVKREGAVARPVLSEVEGRDEQRTIEAWAAEPLPELPPAGTVEPLYDLPHLSAGPVLFASQIFDPEAAAEEARRSSASGGWANAALADRLWPAEERRVRPLMPLRRGHLVRRGGLIAAGFLNNILLEAAPMSRSSARCSARQSLRWTCARAGSR